MVIVRGTTPTIKFTLPDIEVSNINAAVLALKQNNIAIIEKDLSSATLSDHEITWKLQQEDTLKLNKQTVITIVCDWKLVDGTRGRSESVKVGVDEPAKTEVI